MQVSDSNSFGVLGAYNTPFIATNGHLNPGGSMNDGEYMQAHVTYARAVPFCTAPRPHDGLQSAAHPSYASHDGHLTTELPARKCAVPISTQLRLMHDQSAMVLSLKSLQDGAAR